VAGVAAPLPATVSSPLVGLRSLADLAMPAALARPRLPPPATVAAALVAAVVAPGSQPLVAADGDAGPNADPAAAATAIEVVEQDLQWAGSARAVVRPVEIAFPAALARIGVEAEVEVQLTVAADGLPGRGEIRRSSGDGAVDAAVVQALRGYLFAAGEQAVALNLTVRFRYERPF
jgi:TonB family protein